MQFLIQYRLMDITYELNLLGSILPFLKALQFIKTKTKTNKVITTSCP